MAKIAFLGLGVMGLPMPTRLGLPWQLVGEAGIIRMI